MKLFRLLDELAEHVSLRLDNAALRAERDRLQEQVVFFKEMVDYYDELEQKNRPRDYYGELEREKSAK